MKAGGKAGSRVPRSHAIVPYRKITDEERASARSSESEEGVVIEECC
jgi:hypothetical protein